MLGSPAWAGGVRSLLRNQPDLPVLELEVPELSEEDKRQLCTHLGVTASDRPATLRYPGDLVATSEPSMRTPTYRQWLEQKPVKILLTGLILLGLLLLVSLLLDREPPQPEVAQPFQAESLPEAPAQPLTLTPEGAVRRYPPPGPRPNGWRGSGRLSRCPRSLGDYSGRGVTR
ncbi:hypothetical protein MBH78_01315 [Oceanimonas sp. NS1]|nr:hypothetical protein [Oceanimonas sp. NS1]